ncbi:hypothetical protein [Mangrovimonas xylaniphaga]|uniref:hypothetical protein n=1 Tax=Mangrovimonas xylaniphaga TaxID=1645915 RepID=UPI0006B699F4|nr:hypothetical protein [Mangrovimonas xylaniphaga]
MRFKIIGFTFKKLLLLIFLALCSLKNHSYSQTTNCFSEEQIKIIKTGIDHFESKLQDRYPDMNIEMAYFKYVDDLSTKKITSNFFLDSISRTINDQIRKLKVWNTSIRSDENMNREAKLLHVEEMNEYNVKLDKNISDCLTKQTDCEGIENLLVANSKLRLSPNTIRDFIYAGASESDFKEEINKMALVLCVYYQIAFNIQK